VIIRDEKQADVDAIHELVAAAFQRADEAVLIDRLRSDEGCVISLVAVEGDEIIGHILFSRMTAPFRALGLGPVSVKPSRQRAGIGSLLIRTGLDRASGAGWRAVFVLGDPKFYGRFGFDPDLAGGFTCRYSGPHLMALALGRELPATEGVIEYTPAFDSLGLADVGRIAGNRKSRDRARRSS
jgi:putative acetyltransferase